MVMENTYREGESEVMLKTCSQLLIHNHQNRNSTKITSPYKFDAIFYLDFDVANLIKVF